MRVVVVGGGIAGSVLAKTVQQFADVVLIDPKEFFEVPWADLRSTVELSFAERSVINHKEYLKNGRLITSAAIDLTDKEVVTADGCLIPYDYVVIATGHTYNSVKTRRERLQKFQEDNLKIRCANSIMIVGGGPTGVELAAEIALDYPDKKVTLVHSGPRLLQFIGPKAAAKAFEWLKSRNVEVLLEQSIDLDSISPTDREFRTSTGELVLADYYFSCVGKPIGSSWLQESIVKGYLDRKGRLMVDENLRVGGLPNVFAIGDITDISEMKQGVLAQRHALLVAKNLKLLMRGGNDCKLARYRPSRTSARVSLGRKDAVVQFSLITFSGFVPGMFWPRDLFTVKTTKLLGLDSKQVYL
ncbi:hypothetical protein HPP92_005787 [Vanilla planifolia]|uniref:FAD/NAD(P)-binding domain-containing protein n=1 Tax=Vanilla planifolia TaxID=51239 RepID=A0A835RNH2_VANPL|nr:hypothetical protein HPP92_005787 [Vanilla planifolia]